MERYILKKNCDFLDNNINDIIEIGSIYDTHKSEIVMNILYSRNLYDEVRYHLCINCSKENEVDIFVDDYHMSCFFDKPKIFLSLALHEYGHYINGDFNQIETLNSEDIKNERMQCLLENRVMVQEQKADAFAVKYVGKNTFMRSLDYLIKKRKERNDNAMLMAIKELELRKNIIKSLKL